MGSSIAEEIPDGLKEIWQDLIFELHKNKFDSQVESLLRSVQNTNQLVNSTRMIFEPEKQPSSEENVSSPSQMIEARKNLVSSIQLHAMTLNSLEPVFSHLSLEAKGLVSKVLDWIVKNLVDVLSNFSEQLRVDNWAVEVTGGLPLGFSFSLTITFK